MSPKDDMRAQIAAKFRRVEPEDEVPFDGDMSNPATSMASSGGLSIRMPMKTPMTPRACRLQGARRRRTAGAG